MQRSQFSDPLSLDTDKIFLCPISTPLAPNNICCKGISAVRVFSFFWHIVGSRSFNGVINYHSPVNLMSFGGIKLYFINWKQTMLAKLKNYIRNLSKHVASLTMGLTILITFIDFTAVSYVSDFFLPFFCLIEYKPFICLKKSCASKMFNFFSTYIATRDFVHKLLKVF